MSDESDSSPRVLIVDESRIARAMLARQIRNHYALREEANGELAWQALVIDPSIKVVVCSLSMPVLNGDELLARMRASALSRLVRMPVLLVVGDNADAVERAKSHGATEFIDRQALATDLLARIDAALKGAPSDMSHGALAPASDKTVVEDEPDAMPEQAAEVLAPGAARQAIPAEAPEFSAEETITLHAVVEPPELQGGAVAPAARTPAASEETVLLPKGALLALAKQAMGRAKANNRQVNALVMEFDNVDGLREQHGDDMVQQLQQRFVAILGGRVRENDKLGRYVGDRLAIISPDIGSVDCEAFSNRLRKAIKRAKISAHGDRLSLSVSVGIGNFPADGVASAEALLELASRRLEEAQAAGGDCVIAADANLMKMETPTLEQALALLETGCKDKVSPHLPALGYRLLPLLKMLDRELKLGLSLGSATAKLQAMMRSGGDTLTAPKIDARQAGG